MDLGDLVANPTLDTMITATRDGLVRMWKAPHLTNSEERAGIRQLQMRQWQGIGKKEEFCLCVQEMQKMKADYLLQLNYTKH